MSASGKSPDASREEILSALFAQLVIQQTNMALMLLGRLANPQTGEIMHDHEAAGFFIDQLDMLEARTRGNLSPEEEQLLKQSLMNLRLAFVETVNAPVDDKTATGEPVAAVTPETPDRPAAPETGDTTTGKKFSKKY